MTMSLWLRVECGAFGRGFNFAQWGTLPAIARNTLNQSADRVSVRILTSPVNAGGEIKFMFRLSEPAANLS